MAGGTPAFPASRVLGARASRSHDSRNALLGNAASRHARKKPTPLREGREWRDSARAGICELWLGDWYNTVPLPLANPSARAYPLPLTESVSRAACVTANSSSCA